ncbi:MAG TPA: hypothetical protein VMC09_02545 [Anaerolineales bacterium]|nr:hypothetical protein [Anaerolineales bacterium]
MKMSGLDRILLLLTIVLAGYQIAIGVDEMTAIPILAYTIGFGVLVVSGLLMLILGFEALESPIVVIISTIIPLSLSAGLVWEFLAAYRSAYLGFCILGFLAVLLTRISPAKHPAPLAVLATVHGSAGMVIFGLPLFLAATGSVHPGFMLVGVGGALIGFGGLLLLFVRAGSTRMPIGRVYALLPGLLLAMVFAFVAGFALA